MNIHVITSSYPAHPDDPTGTAGLFVRQFALELANRGHRVVVQPAGIKAGYEPDQEIAVVPAPWLGGDRELASMSLVNPLNWLVFLHYFACGVYVTCRINRSRAIERCLCMWAVPSGIFGLAGKLMQGVPYDVWALGSDIWKIRRIPLIGTLMLKIIMRHADRVFADGYQLARDVEELTGVPCTFLPSSRKMPPCETAVPPDPAGPIRFLFVGRYHLNKGPDLLVEAISCLPGDVRESVRVEMFGFGPMQEELIELANSLGVEHLVKIGAPVGVREFSHLLASASFLVIPSRIESIPVVFSDALQSGTPVIAMPVGDLGPAIRESGCGVVAAEVTPEALAAAIMVALTRGKDSFLEGIARAYEPLKPEHAVETWLGCHGL